MQSRLAVIISFFMLYALTALLACSGPNYGGPDLHYRPALPWSEALVFESRFYTVKTNTDPETARYIGALMDRAADEYRTLLGPEKKDRTGLLIHAYADRRQYEDVVRQSGLPANVTAGLYSPVPPAAIHLPYVHTRFTHPALTLLHEGVHQWIDLAVGFDIPATAVSAFAPPRQHLVSLPLWLSEGMATYMEGSLTDDGRIDIGRINRRRLVHLQRLVRSGKCPPLTGVLAKPYGQAFLSSDYAVAWGLVYSLRHALPVPEQAERRERLTQYVNACRLAFFKDPNTQFNAKFLPDGRPPEDFMRKWFTYIAEQSLTAFEQIIVPQGQTLASWQRDWQTRILAIDPE